MIKKLKEILTSKVSMETEETEMETSVNNNSTKSKTLGVNTAVCNLKELEQIKDILGAQQIALEIFTNICSFADDELDELDDNSSSSSESIADSFMNSDDHPISKESLTLPSESMGSFLLLAANDADLAVSAEALDALFDVYGQDVDIVYEAERRIALIDHLNSLFPTFKDKVQHQKKLTPEQKLVVQTVRNNFQRFIQYKMSKSW